MVLGRRTVKPAGVVAVRLALTTALLAVFVGGCGQMPKPKYGPAHNGQRASRGIPSIPVSWRTYSVFDDRTSWTNPVFNSGQWDRSSGIRAGKDLTYDARQILQEQDIYYSGRKIRDPAEGEVDEKMIITYSYVDEVKGKQPWKCDVSWGPHAGTPTLAEAQTILRDWAIPAEDIPEIKVSVKPTTL
jgi:hypothetical protein